MRKSEPFLKMLGSLKPRKREFVETRGSVWEICCWERQCLRFWFQFFWIESAFGECWHARGSVSLSLRFWEGANCFFCRLMPRQQLKSVRWGWMILSFCESLEGQMSPISGFETDMPRWCRSLLGTCGVGIKLRSIGRPIKPEKSYDLCLVFLVHLHSNFFKPSSKKS